MTRARPQRLGRELLAVRSAGHEARARAQPVDLAAVAQRQGAAPLPTA